ncbi:MAG: hypothetical protein HWD59_12230 [Coxiellaceae bacterium]|nr:MAG: hypothetical protein HWD59_12230 [Coxiellaceae bacterium]
MLEETQVNAVNNNNGEDTKTTRLIKNPDIMYVSIMFSQSKIWQKFIEIVKECVEKKHNGKERGYPIIKLNMDNSVSIYMSSHEEKFLLEADSKIKVDRTFFTSGFDKQAENFNLSLIDNQERALTIIDERSIDVVQYKFNFSIYDLDTILKQNVHYTGYKDQQRLLSILKKNIPLKPGMIRLFPLLTDPINDKASMIRVAGCQTITAISVQLVQLYSPEITDIKINHGMAIGMKEKVGLDGMQVINAVIDILMAEGLLNDRKDFPPFGGTGLITILNPSNEGPLKISEMDASSRDFYAHYGSCGTEELKICKSLEVDTLCLLNYFRQTLDF